ncbi:hypothetical protein Nepgr_028491 [Nepenthes gracilis]|uniref:Peptidase metallopeptidase domain-containing protein n=1 Tax=Nepenthes gracilis TaxID=150966 RepID=A0AAD3TCG5_NEPGR|nr:hypothetical protein Nepgr_028491 [Nepenthes gracilis]
MRFPFFSYYCYYYSVVGLIYVLLFFQIPAFPARKISAPVRVLTADAYNATWGNFEKFIDVGKGSRVSGMSELKQYFHRFGYLSPMKAASFDDVFDDSFQSAVMKYQENLGLPVTGKLDSVTIKQIVTPRCGVSDSIASGAGRWFHITKHFAYFYGHPRWVKSKPITLTYAFAEDHLIDYLSLDEIKAVFRRAFSRWEAVIPMNFTEVEHRVADVRIGFFRGDHGDGEPFDGVLGALAHAFSPENGRLHLDAAETWAVDFKSQKSSVAVDLESVATHEIGHVLGLAHSSVKEAIMYPSLSPRTKKVDLRIDDVVGVQALYGSNPNFKLSSLLESDSTSNQPVDSRTGSCRWAVLTATIFLILWS